MTNINAKTKICIIIGDPVEHSLSPLMHNSAYEALGIDDRFVFTAAHVKVEDVGKVLDSVRLLNIKGLTCTVPHKVEVIKYLDEVAPIAKKIGAVNTVLNENGRLIGFNTDWEGLSIPLLKAINSDNLKDKKVALIGAGGAARAIAFAVNKKGADLKIYNRTIEEAKNLAQEYECEYALFDQIEEVGKFDIIINATILGMGEFIDQSPVPIEYLSPNQIVFDIVYSPLDTKLLKDAKSKGAKTISGLEMLLYQGILQFEIYTGQKAPEEVMRKALYSKFNIYL